MYRFPGIKRGTTLAEVMVAIGILAVGLLALVQVQAYTARARKVSQNKILATQRAGSELAVLTELASQDFSVDLRQTDVPIEHGMTLTVKVDDNWNGSPTLKGLTVIINYPSGPQEKGGRVRAWTLVRQ